MKIENNGNLVLGPFDESTPGLMIVLMNCQTKLRINPLTAVKSVAILETGHPVEGLVTLTAVPLGLGSNLGEGMDVCKCVSPLRHEGTLNSHRVASSLVRLVEGGKRWEVPDHLQGVFPQNWGRTEPKRTVTSLVLKAVANDRRTTSPLPR
ncbi:uncharacterized protein TNCV_2557531 [Trichonephila clavipes]|nr:uncharacterized protein TNCV_2557531 [Trichonephila clavipes]